MQARPQRFLRFLLGVVAFVLLPLAQWLPRSKRKVVFCNDSEALLPSNFRALFASVGHGSFERVIYLTRRVEGLGGFGFGGLESLQVVGPVGLWHLLTARVVVAESEPGWFARIASIGAKTVLIGSGLHPDARGLRLARPWTRLFSRLLPWDIVVSPSVWYSRHVLGEWFHFERVVEDHYPRAESVLPFSAAGSHRAGLDRDAMRRMRDAREEGRKVIIVVPAPGIGREVARDVIEEAPKDALVAVALSREDRPPRSAVLPGRSVVLVRRESDPYPLMRFADVIVTDFSAIYFDVLHADRRIVFFHAYANPWWADRVEEPGRYPLLPGVIAESSEELRHALARDDGADESEARAECRMIMVRSSPSGAGGRFWVLLNQLARGVESPSAAPEPRESLA